MFNLHRLAVMKRELGKINFSLLSAPLPSPSQLRIIHHKGHKSTDPGSSPDGEVLSVNS